jgi:hypothetical protein
MSVSPERHSQKITTSKQDLVPSDPNYLLISDAICDFMDHVRGDCDTLDIGFVWQKPTRINNNQLRVFVRLGTPINFDDPIQGSIRKKIMEAHGVLAIALDGVTDVQLNWFDRGRQMPDGRSFRDHLRTLCDDPVYKMRLLACFEAS